jgi:UDP-N-acetylmuramate--alanine ligase
VTNIDHEHLENYGGFDDLQQAFVDFANKVPFYGAVIACLDDANLAAILPRVTRRLTTYGLDAPDADLTATDIELGPLSATAMVERRARRPDASQTATITLGKLTLAVPGRHNLENALAAVAVGLELGLPFDRIAAGLGAFRGAERRFEVRGEPRGILVVDDYGHHPTEITAVLNAALALKRRIVVAFQPHRYTRTASLMEAFGPSLAGASHVVLTDIYGAGEDPIPGVTVDALAAAIRRRINAPVDVVRRLDDLVPAVVRVAQRGDVVITLGAGSIGGVVEQLVAALETGA